MLAALDTLTRNGVAAESAVDWEQLRVETSGGAAPDLHTLYQGLNDTQRATFRKAFVASFSQAFQAQTRGLSFSQAARPPGKFRLLPTGGPIGLETKGARPMRLEFRRVGGQLKLTRLRW
jgi:hypothetical protein